jgi:hypothetical protein
VNGNCGPSKGQLPQDKRKSKCPFIGYKSNGNKEPFSAPLHGVLPNPEGHYMTSLRKMTSTPYPFFSTNLTISFIKNKIQVQK